MTKYKPISNTASTLTPTTLTTTPADAQPPQPMITQQPAGNVSALSQQLEQVSLDKNRQPAASPKRRPSSKRTSKSDYGTGSGTDISPPTQTNQPKPKRSPKSNK